MSLFTKVTLPNGALYNQSQTFLGAGSLFTTGTVYFVSSVTGADGNSGTDPSSPKATVDGAINACTANKGDKVIVMPGHAETITSTSTSMDVAGVSVICLGTGLERPTFTYSTAAATINVSAANCAFMGGHHIGNFLDVASAFTLAAAKDFKLIGNTFEDSTASLNFLSIVTTGATANSADQLEVIDNRWYGLNTSPLAFISILSTIKNLKVIGNDVNSKTTADVATFITFADKNSTGTIITDNTLFVVGSTGAAVGIFLTGSGTAHNGIVARNLVTSLDTTAELIATAGTGLAFFNNYYTGVADASGKLWPVVDAA